MRRALYLTFLMCTSIISFAILFTLFSKEEPFFLLRGVKISGCSQASERDIMALIMPYLDTTILNISTEKIRTSIMNHPYVKDVRIKRVYPFYLHVEIRERRPVAIWVKGDGTLKVVDEDGCVFRDIMKNEKKDLFLIHAGTESDVKAALSLAYRWIVDGIVSDNFISEMLYFDGGVRLISREKVEIILGKEEFENRLKKAKKVLEDAKKRGVLIRCIDARFEKGAIIREKREG